jgi:hypothetical protein
VLVLRLIRAAVMAAAGAAVTLAQLNLPSKAFWDEQVGLVWGSVVVVALFACYDAVRSVNYVIQAARIREYDNDLRTALSAAVSAIVRDTGASWDEVGVRYYRRRGPPGRRRLGLVVAVMAGADVKDAQRIFKPGQGVHGAAFSEEVIIAEEWRQFVQDATAQGPAAWRKRNERDRYGLSWGHLRRSAQPEGLVASPTFAPDGRPDGCILVSGPLKRPDLTKEEVRRTLDDLATVLDRVGSPPAGWWGAHEQ